MAALVATAASVAPVKAAAVGRMTTSLPGGSISGEESLKSAGNVAGDPRKNVRVVIGSVSHSNPELLLSKVGP